MAGMTAAAQLCVTGRPDEARQIVDDLRTVRTLDNAEVAA